ncbi:MAG: WXG100 family type VII secretion target [Nocardioides sp.]
MAGENVHGSSAGGSAIGQSEGALSRAADRVLEARGDLVGLSGRLGSQLESLRGQWVGAGAAAFGRVHGAWLDQHHRIVGALDGLAGSLRETERDTAAADQVQGDVLSRTAARLGGH